MIIAAFWEYLIQLQALWVKVSISLPQIASSTSCCQLQKKLCLSQKRGKYLQKQIREKILQTLAYQREMTMSRQRQLQHLLKGFFPQSKPIRSDSNPQLLLQFLDVMPQRPKKQETPERIHPLLKKALEHKTKTSIMADQLIGQTRRCKTYNEIAEEEQLKSQKLRDDLLNKRGRNQLSKKTRKRRQPKRKRDSTRNSDESQQKGYGPPYKVTILTKQQLYSELDKRKNDKNRIHAGSRSRSTKHARKIVKEIVEGKKRFADKNREEKFRNAQQSKDSCMTVVQTNPLQKLKDEKSDQVPGLSEEQRYHDHLFGKKKQIPSQKQQETSLSTPLFQMVIKSQIDNHPANQLVKSNQSSFSRQLTQALNPKIVPNNQSEVSQKDRLLEQKRKLAQQNERLEKLLQNIEQTEKNKKIQDRKQISNIKIQQKQLAQKKYTPPTEDRSQSRSNLSNKQQHYNRNHKHSKSNKYRDQSSRSPKKDHKHSHRNYRQQPYNKHDRHRKYNQSSKRDYSSGYINHQPEPDWRKELREVTHYNPHDRKYRERDRMTIQESNFRRINKQEAFSRKMGQIEEQNQLLREKSNRRKY